MNISKKNNKNSNKSKLKIFIISLVTFIIFSLGFFPLFFYGLIINYFLSVGELWHLIFLPFIIFIGITILLISQLLISGLIIKLFNIKYKTGTYDYNPNNKNSFKWMLICTLYTPCRKILEIFILGGIKNFYYRLLGMKIGNNTLIGGIIKDPCVTEFGDNTTMGEYAIIYGHIHNYKKNTIDIQKVKVGNNCIIGAAAIIMPGVIIQDNVTVAAGAIVTKKQVLKKGKIYGGIPAKILNKTEYSKI